MNLRNSINNAKIYLDIIILQRTVRDVKVSMVLVSVSVLVAKILVSLTSLGTVGDGRRHRGRPRKSCKDNINNNNNNSRLLDART